MKKEKELEIARMRAQQERARDYKAEQVRSNARGLSQSHSPRADHQTASLCLGEG